MKKFFTYLLAFAAMATVISCSKSDGPEEPDPNVNGKDFTETVEGMKFDMVYVKGGTFSMGATEEQGSEEYISGSEYPVHSVTLSDFYIGGCEVTQALWKAVMGTTVEQQRDKEKETEYYDEDSWRWSLRGVGSDYPMYYVNWNEAQEFCTKLSQITGKKYALPTEAQWEYAARGGAESKGYKYSGSNTIDEVAWCGEDTESGSTHPVGTKKANELGLYDMSGNVWEWCNDWYGDYSDKTQTNPTGPETGPRRVMRGGGWYFSAYRCRVSLRTPDSPYDPDTRSHFIGFRVVCIP